MKRNHFLTRGVLGRIAVMAIAAALFASCAVDGYDDDERFDSGVTGQQLVSPELSDSCFSTRVNSDGSESVIVSWKVVYGAGGYEVKVYNVDDPNNPVEIAADTVDRPSFIFECTEDTRYNVYVRTLGNAQKNNTEAAEATQYAYSTLVPAQVIPVGTDIADFIAANIKDTQDEQAFELAAGGSYTINSNIDFGDKKVTFRGDKVNHPIVTFNNGSNIQTCAQLKIKFINFVCDSAKQKGAIIQMSDNPVATASASAQGIAAAKNSNKPANVYILQDPILIQECAFKNIPCELFCVGDHPWGIQDLRIDNCVIQLNNDGSGVGDGSLISAHSAHHKHEGQTQSAGPDGNSFWFGCIRNLTVKNSTIYNIVKNSKNRFFRWNNKDIDRVFPTADGTATFTNNTICRVFTGKEFGNNTANQNKYVITFQNNVLLDVFRLQKFIQNNCNTDAVIQSTNTTWGIESTVDNTDKTKWATEEDPGFTIEQLSQPLDFTQSNCGLNLRASGSISSTIGDPRWLPTAE